MVKTEQKIQLGPEKALQSSNSRSLCKKKYKGVRMRSWGSWVSEIRAPNQKTRIWLGSYSTPEAAARAYDAALICLKGASANLNFPNSAISQQFPDTLMSPKSIQRVAAAAAAAANSNVLSDASTNPQSPPPLSTSCTSSTSSTSSPSLSSSPLSNVIEDDLSLEPSSNPYSHTFLDEPMSMTVPWYNFDSPKYTDMLNGAFFDPLMIEDVYEEGDIRLWSFC